MVLTNSLLCSKGVPDPPQKFALQASSTSPSLPPVLSWQRPPNIPDDVPLTYHLQITNLTSNRSDVFNITDTLSYPLPDGTGCSLFEFSVAASNDVGNSISLSIMETVPISKFKGWNEVMATVKGILMIDCFAKSDKVIKGIIATCMYKSAYTS